jgi:16S rRNA (cytosine967-C5)-methyltransferase
MTPGARVQAAIELVATIAESRSPADRMVQAYTRERRYIGAKDRAAILRLTYGVLRHRAQLGWWIARVTPDLAVTPRGLILAALAILEIWDADAIATACDGGRHRPALLSRQERDAVAALCGRTIEHPQQDLATLGNAPRWIVERIEAQFGARTEAELRALGGEAPLDLRANTLRGDREAAQAALTRAGIKSAPTRLSPLGLRVTQRTRLATLPAFVEGLVEVQDEGSQLAALLVDARPGMRVCDFCAGAGGKTLAIAARMANSGRVVACDTVDRRLDGATKRLARAGVFNVERRLLGSERDPWVKRHRESFDRVLVDAPCTGTGTWRRNPDARWSLTPDDLEELRAKQARILDSASRLVRIGGRLIYVTCSMLVEENQSQIAAFLVAHGTWRLVPVDSVWRDTIGTVSPTTETMLQLTPAAHDTDGFFVAILERSAPSESGDDADA